MDSDHVLWEVCELQVMLLCFQKAAVKNANIVAGKSTIINICSPTDMS